MFRTSSSKAVAAAAAVAAVASGAALLFGGGGHGPSAVGPKGLHHSLVYQSGTGNDGTCRINLKSRPCLSVSRACALARPNFVIYRIGNPSPRLSYRNACAPVVPPGTANVWMSTTGSDVGASCAWSATPVTFASIGGNGCATPNKMFSLATSGGGTAGIRAGTYTTDFVIGPNGALTNYVKFIPDAGTVTFTHQICLGSTGSQCVAATNSPSWVDFDANAGSGTFVYQKSIFASYRNVQPQHIIFNGGHTLSTGFASINDVTISNMEVGPDCCSDDGIHSGWGTGTPQTSNVTLTGNYIHGMSQTCANYIGQSADGVGPAVCPGDTAVHVDGIQLDTANNLTVSRNKIQDNVEQGLFFGGTAGGMPTGTSCPAQSTAGCYEGNIVVENNSLAAPLIPGNNEFILGRGSPGTPGDCSVVDNSTNPEFGPSTTMAVNYNSTTGSISLIRSCSLPATLSYVGNIGNYSNLSTCTNQVKPGGTETFSHNFTTQKACGSDTLLSNFTATFVNTAAATADLSLLAGAPEIGNGDPASCPTYDVLGVVRIPPCDAGAYQHVGSGGSGMATGLSSYVTVTSSGSPRIYRSYKPSGLSCTTTACKVVVFMGGSFNPPGSGACSTFATLAAAADCDMGTSTSSCAPSGSACQIFRSDWTTEADSVGIIVLFPVSFGTGDCPSTCRAWGGASGDEAQFIKDMLTQVETSGSVGANIDATHVYQIGFSGGASVTSWTACGGQEGSNTPTSDWSIAQPLFRAFGVWAGGQLGVVNGGHTDNISPACSQPVPKPIIFVSSKHDSIGADYDRTGVNSNGFLCTNVAWAGPTCHTSLQTTTVDYGTRWGCPTGTSGLGVDTVISTGSTYVSYDKHSYETCSNTAASIEWDSCGVGSNAPPHSMTEYNICMGTGGVPDHAWVYWNSH